MNLKLARYRLSRRMTFRGLQISVETDKGEKRHWHDPHEHKSGTTLMHYPYGYIRRTEGTDGDHVDVYVGPNEDAKNVYLVNQMKAPDFKRFDEQKCMLGFNTLDEAKKAYLMHYNKPGFLGSVTTLPFDEFKEKVLKTFSHPRKIAMTTKTALNLQQALKLEGLLGREEAASLFHEISRQSGELGKSAIRTNPQTLQITAQGVKRMPLATTPLQTKLGIMRGVHRGAAAGLERLLPSAGITGEAVARRAGLTAAEAAGPAAGRMYAHIPSMAPRQSFNAADVMKRVRQEGGDQALRDLGVPTHAKTAAPNPGSLLSPQRQQAPSWGLGGQLPSGFKAPPPSPTPTTAPKSIASPKPPAASPMPAPQPPAQNIGTHAGLPHTQHAGQQQAGRNIASQPPANTRAAGDVADVVARGNREMGRVLKDTSGDPTK